ncbi:hypothetical protein PYCC9005_000718 [Savitreella phatthalungensis]
MGRSAKYNRVSSEDPNRFNFEARLSSETPRRYSDDSATLADSASEREKNTTDGDDFDVSEDEIESLMNEDPLQHPQAKQQKRLTKKDARRAARKARKLTRRLGRRCTFKRHLIAIAFLLLVGLGAALAFVKLGSKSSESVNAQPGSDVSATLDNLETVPSLAGNIDVSPEDFADIKPFPMSPVPVDESGMAVNGPPELSPEAVQQAQDIQGDIVTSHSTLSASDRLKESFGGAVDNLRDMADELWAWVDAKWRDIWANSPTSGQPIY